MKNHPDVCGNTRLSTRGWVGNWRRPDTCGWGRFCGERNAVGKLHAVADRDPSFIMGLIIFGPERSEVRRYRDYCLRRRASCARIGSAIGNDFTRSSTGCMPFPRKCCLICWRRDPPVKGKRGRVREANTPEYSGPILQSADAIKKAGGPTRKFPQFSREIGPDLQNCRTPAQKIMVIALMEF